MDQAAADLHATNKISISEMCDEVVSCDGIWQKRGFSSLTSMINFGYYGNAIRSNLGSVTKMKNATMAILYHHAEYGYWKQDLPRIYQMSKKSSDDGRVARKRNRRKRKAKEDENVLKEGVTYGPGEF